MNKSSTLGLISAVMLLAGGLTGLGDPTSAPELGEGFAPGSKERNPGLEADERTKKLYPSKKQRAKMKSRLERIR